MDINRIDETVKRGSTEIWEILNRSGKMMSIPHLMHLHDVQFLILSRNGKIPPDRMKKTNYNTTTLNFIGSILALKILDDIY
ncbi:multicopper oxidase domain-containing protein [uncultured Desulfobacter sp.]|uniref:multicopper oxidase domain-containing protein n=1 Tax=uncultured Desulfobacter sp. TaxID=240139 RepID=UPI002AAAF373|nr:multicopper oxidase domain-containing protein [uncultured Desulfobacter sp.]